MFPENSRDHRLTVEALLPCKRRSEGQNVKARALSLGSLDLRDTQRYVSAAPGSGGRWREKGPPRPPRRPFPGHSGAGARRSGAAGAPCPRTGAAEGAAAVPGHRALLRAGSGAPHRPSRPRGPGTRGRALCAGQAQSARAHTRPRSRQLTPCGGRRGRSR